MKRRIRINWETLAYRAWVAFAVFGALAALVVAVRSVSEPWLAVVAALGGLATGGAIAAAVVALR